MSRWTTVVEVVTTIPAPPHVVFDLELDVDVHTASLAGTGERASTSTGRPVLGPGDEVTFTARHLGRTWSLTSRVVEHDRPRRFVDTQVAGPFRTMRHEHLFEQTDAGTTVMTDRMSFVAPGGPLGALPARLLLAPHLRRLLVRRAAHIRAVAEAAD